MTCTGSDSSANSTNSSSDEPTLTDICWQVMIHHYEDDDEDDANSKLNIIVTSLALVSKVIFAREASD